MINLHLGNSVVSLFYLLFSDFIEWSSPRRRIHIRYTYMHTYTRKTERMESAVNTERPKQNIIQYCSQIVPFQKKSKRFILYARSMPTFFISRLWKIKRRKVYLWNIYILTSYYEILLCGKSISVELYP